MDENNNRIEVTNRIGKIFFGAFKNNTPDTVFSDVLNELENFETKIRKDQDKITRHAAVDAVSDIDNVNPEEFSDIYLIDQDAAMSNIINLKCV